MNAHPPFVRVDRERRARIDQAIERLLALLDELDGDPDLEEDDPPGGDVLDEGEASLGATHAVDQTRAWKPTWPADDLEYDGDTCPDSEAEPSLGSLGSDGVLTQQAWSAGDRRELEDEHDGAEPGEDEEPGDDEEPSLGWTSFEARYGCYGGGLIEDAEQEHDGREPEVH